MYLVFQKKYTCMLFSSINVIAIVKFYVQYSLQSHTCQLSLLAGNFPYGDSQLEILKDQYCPQFKTKQSVSPWV